MTPAQTKIMRGQISKKLGGLSLFKQSTKGVNSWIDYLRRGLGMNISQLAKRAGISRETMSQTISREKSGEITVNNLRRIANALECDFVYCFVPRKKLEAIIENQALKVAKSIVEESALHMEIEDQGQSSSTNRRAIKELAEEIVYKKVLWEE